MDHLYSFKRYSCHRVYYLNIAIINTVPAYFKKIKFDLLIFHTLFLTYHIVQGNYFKKLIDKVRYFQFYNAVKIALPQDEHTNAKDLEDFYKEFGIDHVFTVAPEDQPKTLYPTIDSNKIKFHFVLTGYIDPITLSKILKMGIKIKNKDIDVFYKTGRISPALGRHGVLKSNIADIFNKKLKGSGLNINISNDPKTIIFGNKWYEYLLRSKFTLGIEGGSSVLDYDGSVRDNVKSYLKSHPDVPFEEIEENCFPDMDGKLQYFAISPRHLEACITKTCQILVEGEYNNILKKNIHYIELKKDMSNINEVVQAMKDDKLRKQIVDNAYRDIVESEKYSYRYFANYVISTSLSDKPAKMKDNGTEKIWYLISWFFEYIMKLLIVLNYSFIIFLGLKPEDSIFKRLRKLYK